MSDSIYEAYNQHKGLYRADLPRYRLDRTEASSGRGVRVDRYMKQLVPIIGSSNKRDIKFRPELSSLLAAKEWIKERGKKDKHLPKERRFHNRYEAVEADVDYDGVKDVLVRSKKDPSVIKYINGYTVKHSKQNKRRAFYDQYPTKEARKGKTMNSWLDSEEVWTNEKLSGPKSPYQRFMRYLISPIYDLACERYRLKMATGKNVNFKTQCGAEVWTYYVLPILLAEYLGGGNQAIDDVNWLMGSGASDPRDVRLRKKKLEEIKKHDAFRQRCVNFIDTIRNETNMNKDNKIFDVILNKILDKLQTLINNGDFYAKYDKKQLAKDFGVENENVDISRGTISRLIREENAEEAKTLYSSMDASRNPANSESFKQSQYQSRYLPTGSQTHSELRESDLEDTEVINPDSFVSGSEYDEE